jgi:hypothetical protein
MVQPAYAEPTPILHPQVLGNQVAQRSLQSCPVVPHCYTHRELRKNVPFHLHKKLRIGRSEDEYEVEGDRIAEQATHMPVQSFQRRAEADENELIQVKSANKKNAPKTPALEAQVSALRGGGQPLPKSVRNFFEPRFGADFSRVRVHTGAQAVKPAWRLNARAFTVGRNIGFGTGQYAPHTEEGKKLLAHELAHVVQQKHTKPRVQRHGDHATITTAIEKYRHTLQHSGTTQTSWERGLRNNATFLGLRISRGIHKELADRLAQSEAYLRNRPKHSGLSDTQIAQRVGLYSIDGRRPPGIAVCGSRISYHAFGLAIDINYRGNPFIGRIENAFGRSETARIIQRATNFILGRRINIRALSRNLMLEEVRNTYQEASDALRAYFGFRDDRNALAAHLRRRGLPAENTDVSRWLRIINADYNNETLRNEFRMTAGGIRDRTKGFIDLKEELVLALGRHSGLVPKHQLTWGGDPRVYGAGKDLMHFDWRNGTIKNHHRI